MKLKKSMRWSHFRIENKEKVKGGVPFGYPHEVDCMIDSPFPFGIVVPIRVDEWL